MATVRKSPMAMALVIPGLIFLSCAFIPFTSAFSHRPDLLSLGMLVDLLIVAPAIYFLFIRNTQVNKVSVLRVFVLSVFIAGLVLPTSHIPALAFIKKWISPFIELLMVGFVVQRFRSASKTIRNEGVQLDFLEHCRLILAGVFGNEKAAFVIASEVSVFYYAFKGRSASPDNVTRFSGHKKSGVKMVLGLMLFVLLAEASGMHFVFMLWNKTAAWILTGLSLYTCLQVFAHMRSLSSRLSTVSESGIVIRNGILGGEVNIPFGLVERIETFRAPVKSEDGVKLALLKSFEKHTVSIHLNEPVRVIKAFGMTKNANVILAVIDHEEKFVNAVNARVKSPYNSPA